MSFQALSPRTVVEGARLDHGGTTLAHPPVAGSRKSSVADDTALPVLFRGTTKAFGATQVLRGLDLDIPPGQFVAIVGKSGCGKSTLLRLLVGLEQPTGGSVVVGGQVVAPSTRSDLRVMFQEPRLLPWSRVIDNVRVGLGRERRSGKAHSLAEDALREVGLSEKSGEWPSVLSGGQRQRVALARALVSRPKVLAFDEPLGALDALTRISMQKLLESVWLDQRFTALLVTHDVAEAVVLADRVLLIEDGRIALDITVDLPRPRHRGLPAIAEIEGRILDRLFRNARDGEDA